MAIVLFSSYEQALNSDTGDTDGLSLGYQVRVFEPMIRKVFISSEGVDRVLVTFTVPGSFWANQLDLAFTQGDNLSIQPFRLSDYGNWELILNLPIEQVYRFNYLRDEQQWMGDNNADGYEVSPRDGSLICLLDTGLTKVPIQASYKRLADISFARETMMVSR